MVVSSLLGSLISPSVVELALGSKLEEQREAEQADQLEHQAALIAQQQEAALAQKKIADAKLLGFAAKAAIVGGIIIVVILVSRSS